MNEKERQNAADMKEARAKLLECFPGSFINARDEFIAHLQTPEAFPPCWPEWIRTVERKPTAEDANEDGCVLSINMNRGDMNTTNWPWNVVAAFPDCLPVWMPLPKKPDLKKER